MSNKFKQLFKGGVTRIPREVERAIFFYATLVLSAYTLCVPLLGGK